MKNYSYEEIKKWSHRLGRLNLETTRHSHLPCGKSKYSMCVLIMCKTLVLVASST